MVPLGSLSVPRECSSEAVFRFVVSSSVEALQQAVQHNAGGPSWGEMEERVSPLPFLSILFHVKVTIY